MSDWDRQPGEPNRWFDRFTAWRLLGPMRSYAAVVRPAVYARADALGEARPRQIERNWSSAAARWRWRERAEAWDEQQRQMAEAAVEEARRLLREASLEAAQVLVTGLHSGEALCAERRLTAVEVLDRALGKAQQRIDADVRTSGRVILMDE